MLRDQENFILTVVHIASFEANAFCGKLNFIFDKVSLSNARNPMIETPPYITIDNSKTMCEQMSLGIRYSKRRNQKHFSCYRQNKEDNIPLVL